MSAFIIAYPIMHQSFAMEAQANASWLLHKCDFACLIEPWSGCNKGKHGGIDWTS